MPSSGCNALSSDGTCFNTFATLVCSWHVARLVCLLRGYDLATITSVGENGLLWNIYPGYCLFGIFAQITAAHIIIYCLNTNAVQLKNT